MTVKASTDDRWANKAHSVCWSELECHSTPPVPYPLDLRATVLPRALTAFEAIRAMWGRVIAITSFYRTPAYNRAIGGAVGSRHCFGEAFDIEPPEGVSAWDCYTHIVALQQARPDLGIGYVCGYAPCPSKPRGQIHADVGPARGHTWEDAP